MIGAIFGDIVGSAYEWDPVKRKDFALIRHTATYTDDTVMTVAVAHTLLTDGDYVAAFKTFGRRHPNRGYGTHFNTWLASDNTRPYGSWGNGSAMHVSPVAWARDSIDEVLAEAERSAAVTHDHPEGIKGAQATALAVYLARTGHDKANIAREVTERYGYDLTATAEQIRPTYSYDVSCQGSLPQSLVAFLASDSLEDTVRTAVSFGGDADTMACIAGGVAEAYFGGATAEEAAAVRSRLSADLNEVVDEFRRRFVVA